MAFDFLELQKKRIYAQYKDKPNAVKWLSINPSIANQFAVMLEKLQNSYDIDLNEGVQLDVIGRLVGQNRNFRAESMIVFVPVAEFSSDANNAEEFGDESAQFSAPTEPFNGVLNDLQYRKALKTRINKNASSATIDEIVQSIKLVLDDDVKVFLHDGQNMSFSIDIEGNVSAESQLLLKSNLIVNRPQGVGFEGYTLNATQFSGDATSAPEFGDETTEFVGSIGGS